MLAAVAQEQALTHRERQVLGLMARGDPYKIIAHDLGLSVSTVSTHLARALRKLGIGSRKHLLSLTPSKSPFAAHPTLSPTEQAVAVLLARGETNRSIARCRGVSPHTIAKQVATLLRKIGAQSRFEAIAVLGENRGYGASEIAQMSSPPNTANDSSR
jgi:DNA-binding CsgD family transcriptional regulator